MSSVHAQLLQHPNGIRIPGIELERLAIELDGPLPVTGLFVSLSQTVVHVVRIRVLFDVQLEDPDRLLDSAAG